MYLTTFNQDKQVEQKALAVDPASIYKAFEQVKDRRGKKGKRYPLALILTLVMLGKMAGETKIDGIIYWINLRKNELKRVLNWPREFPSNSTYSRALASCNGKEVAEIVAGVITKARAVEKCGDEPSRLVAQKKAEEKLTHTAMDGKTLRGTLKHTEETMPSVHILTLYDCITGITHEQYVYKNDESELSAVNELLLLNLLKNRIVTTDALHTYKRWCACVHRYGGYYLTTVKKNTSALYQNIADYFGDEILLMKECDYFKKVQKGHGRLEIREIWTSTQMNEFLEKEWIGIAQVFMIRKTVIEKGEKLIIIRYGITSLPRKKANTKRILELRQNHWLIENRSHYRRDVTLGEDACQVRINGAPEVLSAINGVILALMDFLGIKNLAKQLKYYCAYPKEAIQLLFGKLSRQNK